MIGGIGSTGSGRIDGARPQSVQGPAKARAAGAADSEAPVSTPASELAASGPPVDADKVARVRAAIASGAYSIDVQAIAARMVDLDLPQQG